MKTVEEITQAIAELQLGYKNATGFIGTWQASRSDIARKIEVLRAELAEAKKPKLRHGDYGIGNSTMRIALWDERERKLTQGGCNTFPCGDSYLKPSSILGNIFDDLKALQEPLKEFEIDGSGYKLTAKAQPNSDILLSIAGYGEDRISTFIPLKRIPKLILNLRRVERTMKAKAK